MERQGIEIPYCPRNWARPVHANLRRWIALVLHRRAGKTTFELNHHQRAALNDPWEARRLRSLLPQSSERHIRRLMLKRIYWHVMPSYKQAKLVAWEMLKDIARPIPGHKFNESELLVIYPNDHRIQLIGADNPDSLRGPGLSGLSLDEFSQHPPKVFGEILSKALADHLGYCIWSGTIKGQDQLYHIYEAAKDDPDWYALWQDIDVSLTSETGATITALTRAMADDRKLIANGVMSQEEYDQEWYLSPLAAVRGTYYAKQIAEAHREKRVRPVPYDPALPVHDVWDLGAGANMAIGLFQRVGRNVQMIEYLEGKESDGIPQMIATLQRKPYVYGKHFAPHDIKATDLSTGKTRWETAKALGWEFTVVKDLAVVDGINAGRLMFARLWVDETACAPWLTAMAHYRRPWLQKHGIFGDHPVHDFSSHPADMYRYAAVAEELMTNEVAPPITDLGPTVRSRSWQGR